MLRHPVTTRAVQPPGASELGNFAIAVKVNRLKPQGLKGQGTVMAAKAESGPKGRAARVGNPDLAD